MKFWKTKPLVSILLAALLLLGTLPIPAMAEETKADTGLCEHHTEHTDACGYSPGSPASPCQHEHTDGCWGIQKVLDCPHERGEHDDTCGYSQETPATPCSYDCPLCGTQDIPPEPDLQDGTFLHSISGQLKPDASWNFPASFFSGNSFRLPSVNTVGVPVETGKFPASTFTWIYINGKPVKRGETITASVGDGFSYHFTWGLASQPAVNEGDAFTHELFRVPGLSLPKTATGSLIVNGIRIGEWETNYDSKTGAMTYRAVFNRYIKMFELNTIVAQFQGNGKFINVTDHPDTGIFIDGDADATASLTVKPAQTAPVVPSVPSGVGWSPQKPPQFTYQPIPFGKGLKWSSKNNPDSEPLLDWRVAFLGPLQRAQQEFLDTGTFPEASSGYCIIEDTLDENQAFYFGVSGPRYPNNVPFHLELPVMVTGTNQILNGAAMNNLQNGNYDGPGEINTFITGEHFTKIDGSGASTKEEVKEVQAKVKAQPLTWTITTDPETRRQTLLINAGKLGGTDRAQGVTWGMATGETNWPEKRLQEQINQCDSKIQDIQLGVDSPIQLLDNRYRSLSVLLQRIILLADNAGVREQAEQDWKAWKENYQAWRDHPQIGPLRPLTDSSGTLILPQEDLPDSLKSLKTSNQVLLTSSQEYKNYKISRDNLEKDQKTYLENRKSYGEDWAAAKQLYQQTKDFYEEGRVFGFVLKCFTISTNPSMTTYSNNVTLTVDGQTWEAEDTENNLQFSNVIIGNYALGSVVLQKADSFYEELQQVQKDKSGLTGAEFRVYSADDTGNPVVDGDHLAYFLDKDASKNKDAYTYTHTGPDAPGLLKGDQTSLQTNSDGRLVIHGLSTNQPHFLVETKAPDGYYLDPTPIEFTADSKQVVYRMVRNVSRSVLLHKKDSYSKNPIQGAEFTLYRKGEKDTLTELSGFSKKSLNGHETYWLQPGGTEKLVTNEEGALCIHGLGAGTYVLRETKAASGYELASPEPEREFTLTEELPKDPSGYDDNYHVLLGDLENDPETNSVTITKLDGSTPAGTNKTKLKGAVYGLFRYTGTEADWAKNPSQNSFWQAVDLSDTSSAYFKTQNTISEVPGRKGNLSGVETNAAGEITMDNIPTGHYFFRELGPPEHYILDDSNYYFDVTGKNGNVSLRGDLADTAQTIANNLLYNYHNKAKLALVKYDLAEQPPEINGTYQDGGYLYEGASLKEGASGLSGAVYKLFEADISANNPNPDPGELTGTDLLTNQKPDYDRCLAVGVTDERGVLLLDNMTDQNGKHPYEGTNGLNMGSYYLVEVQAPEGYLLDQTPIPFILNHGTFPKTQTTRAGEPVPGLWKLAGNRKLEYGVRLTKTDKEDPDRHLQYAGFTVTKAGEDTPCTFSYDLPNKQYHLDPTGTITEVLTDENGVLTVSGLEKGATYQFEETVAPQGYVLPETPYRITVDGDIQEGHLILTETTVTNPRNKGIMMLHKQDGETKEPLKGATFQLYKTVVEPLPEDHPLYDPDFPEATDSKDVPVGPAQTTDENGNITFEGLEWGEWYFALEVEAPEGYRLDATKLSFSIDENSFDSNGDPIPVIFPHVQNMKGSLQEVVITKVDQDDPTITLPDAHFLLTKQIIDSGGNEFWPVYSTGLFITDGKGQMSFLLPPGEYHLTEMKAPDGYLIREFSHGGYFFEVEEPGENSDLQKIELSIENQKADAGIYLKKTMNGTNIPLANVTFRFWIGDNIPMLPAQEMQLYFIEQKPGFYECVGKEGETDLPADASPDVKTDVNGELRLLFSERFLPEKELSPWESLVDKANKVIKYQEVSAPENILVNPTQNYIPGDTLNNQWWCDISVNNPLKNPGTPSILLHKTNEEGVPLAGAEFALHNEWRLGDKIYDLLVETKTTDSNGEIRFDVNLMLGQNYYVVETKAPQGYILDETHHEISLDQKALDANGYVIPVKAEIENTKIKGSVVVEKKDPYGNPLPNAEFELMHWADGQWEHYGESRYITDANGEIRLTLPHGTYRWFERAAPIGYLPDSTKPIEFSIEQDHSTQVLEVINREDPNPKGSVTVTKVDQEDRTPLSGAKFQLFYLGQDGQYYRYHTHEYQTDSAGQFKIPELPMGSYAFEEIQAPAGYPLPGNKKFPFSIAYAGQEVKLLVPNTKTVTPVPPTGPTGGSGSSSPGDGSFSNPVVDDSAFWLPDHPNSQPPGDTSSSQPSGDSSESQPPHDSSFSQPSDSSVSSRPFGDSSAFDPDFPDGPAKTGDHTNLTVWFVLMGCSAGGMGVFAWIWIVRKKKSK